MMASKDSEEISDGTRTRKLTEKGVAYQLGAKQKVYKHALSSVRSCGQKLCTAVMQNERIENVEVEYL